MDLTAAGYMLPEPEPEPHEGPITDARLDAESWCGRCRALRPAFDDRARRAASHEVWLWLDMEEHDEFIGGFIPDDMPLLLVYRAGQIAHAELATAIALDRVLKGEESGTIAHSVPEQLIARLLAENWQPIQ